MDVAVVAQQTFLRCVVKVRPVIYSSLLAGCAAEDFWFPCIAVIEIGQKLLTRYSMPDRRRVLECDRIEKGGRNKGEFSYRWLSKWMTFTGPYARFTLRSNGKVIVWSPPSVINRGRVLPCFDGPLASASVTGERDKSLLWPSSICLMA